MILPNGTGREFTIISRPRTWLAWPAWLAAVLLGLTAAADVRGQERNRARDFDFTLETHDPGQYVGGVWTDGTTMWMLQGPNESLVAYDMATGRRDPAKSVTASLMSALRNSTDLWSNGTTIWILAQGPDSDNYKLWAFSMATWERDSARDVELGSRDGGAMWSDGTTIWIADGFVLLAYDWATGRREPARDVRSDYFRAGDIWSDGETMWIAGRPDRYEPPQPKVRAYDLATGQRESAKEIDTGDIVPVTLESDGRTMWIGDSERDQYAYALNTGTRDPQKDVSLLVRPVVQSQSLWSNGEKMWVVSSDDKRVWVYDLATGSRDLAFMAENLGGDRYADYLTDIWSDGTTIWAAYRWTSVSGRATDKLYAHDLTTGGRDSAKDVELDSLYGQATYGKRRIWSDGRTLWMMIAIGRHASDPEASVYAYDFTTGRRVPGRDFVLDSENLSPSDLWSDGTTMWVTDTVRGTFAYDLASGNRDPAKDFGRVRRFERLGSFTSIWSDGATFWVTVGGDTTLFAYDLATGSRRPAEDYTSFLGPFWGFGNRHGGFSSDGTTLWLMEHNVVTVFDLARNREPARHWFGLERVSGSDGVWIDEGRTLWALHFPRVHAYYGLDSGPERGRTLFVKEARHVSHGRGDLWSDGATMWIPAGAGNPALGQSTAPRLYGYDWTTGDWREGFERSPDREFALDPANINPSGLWSDGATMWVADAADAKLYAYDWPLLSHRTSK